MHERTIFIGHVYVGKAKASQPRRVEQRITLPGGDVDILYTQTDARETRTMSLRSFAVWAGADVTERYVPYGPRPVMRGVLNLQTA